jgi:phosphoglycolate phosphatase-like HAD superfamily hydrolase
MNQEFLVCIDSDGCVFDSMTFKHRECLTQVFIEHFSLHAIEPIARETWEYVNLHSRSRGCNRFHALLDTLALLRQRPEVAAAGLRLPELAGLARWVRQSAELSNQELEQEFARTGDPDLGTALSWSRKGNALMDRTMGNGIPPFPMVKPALESLSRQADIIVVSQGPTERISREWHFHGLGKWPRRIMGHEFGPKERIVRNSLQGRFLSGNVLVIGDSPCDADAARQNGAHFYPIVPGMENESWECLVERGVERFFSGRFTEEFCRELAGKFESALLDAPPWCV